MKKVYYEKRGRRYYPVSEYDSDLLDSFSKGSHLVCVYPGGQTRRYNVEPNHAAMIAAGRVAEDAISAAISQASEIRLRQESQRNPLTPAQRRAWNKLIKEFGPSARQLEWASVREIAEVGVKAMQKEAEELMRHPAVREAYEQFQLVCALTKEHKNEG